MIVNASQLEGKWDGLSELLEQTSHVGLNGIETLDLLVIIHEHIWVNLVDENLIPNVCLDSTRLLDHLEKFLARALVIRIMSIDHVDQSATILNVLDWVTLEHVVAWEVDDVELDVVVVVDCLSLDVARRQQEKRLVGRHLLEYDLADACLSRSELVEVTRGVE